MAKLGGMGGSVEEWVAKRRDGWLSRWRQLATAALWVRTQTSLKNHIWAKRVADTL